MTAYCRCSLLSHLGKERSSAATLFYECAKNTHPADEDQPFLGVDFCETSRPPPLTGINRATKNSAQKRAGPLPAYGNQPLSFLAHTFGPHHPQITSPCQTIRGPSRFPSPTPPIRPRYPAHACRRAATPCPLPQNPQGDRAPGYGEPKQSCGRSPRH
jgi:hypothetical protein